VATTLWPTGDGWSIALAKAGDIIPSPLPEYPNAVTWVGLTPPSGSIQETGIRSFVWKSNGHPALVERLGYADGYVQGRQFSFGSIGRNTGWPEVGVWGAPRRGGSFARRTIWERSSERRLGPKTTSEPSTKTTNRCGGRGGPRPARRWRWPRGK